jgi:Na+-transporting NADH:ubiquinone oxidoreductase subunit A
MRITIKKGLDIPIAGIPDAAISDAAAVETVAVLGTDVVGLRPRMAVAVGDTVQLGQPLFSDSANPGVHFTSPGCGKVIAVNRGARRALQSVVIQLDGDDAVEYPVFSATDIAKLDGSQVRQNLLASGLWTAFRTRPFSRIPRPDGVPAAIFVTVTDTNPLAADPDVILAEDNEAFGFGLEIIARLTDGSVHVCTGSDSSVRCPETEQFNRVEFQGPHPAGLVGTHIHFLDPVSESKSVWHIRYPDVVAIGQLFANGRLPTERIISLCGPMALRPRLLRTRLGASTKDLLRGETAAGALRVISGSVLSGHRALGPLGWLGRYHNQITVLPEGGERKFLEWMRPGRKRYSSLRAYAGHLLNRGEFPLSTSQNGSPRAVVPIGSFERVMPLDILATPLLKALLVEDTDKAKELGCLELDEEDLALCSFVCNGKYEYGPFLRMNLDEIEENG